MRRLPLFCVASRTVVLALIGLVIGLTSVTTLAETKLDIRIDTAGLVFEEFQTLPESGIPPALLERASGLAIIPNVLKVGFGLGARFGRGVLVFRDDQGRWQGPVFITFGSGSIGWQLGAQAADLVLVFRDRETLLEISTAKFTLGADAAVAAGPVGRAASAATDVSFDAAVYSYSRSRGLFAGVALDGAVLNIDHKDNARFYADPGASIKKLLESPPRTMPVSAGRLLTRIGRLAPGGADDGAPGVTSAAGSDVPSEDSDPAVRTFGIGEEPLDDTPAAVEPNE